MLQWILLNVFINRRKLTGDLNCNQYLNINAWIGYGTGQAKLWYYATTANNKALRMDNVNNLTLSKGNYITLEINQQQQTLVLWV